MPDGAFPLRVPSFITPSVIIESVSATMSTTVADLLGKRRDSNLNAARQICCLLFAEFTVLSKVEMGAVIGRPNNGGGWHLFKEASARIADDQCFRGAFEQARERLLQGFRSGCHV